MAVTAEEERRKNPELNEEDLLSVKEWISKQPHLPQNIPDELLIIIMHSCYFRMELTKKTIDQYFTLRTHIPEFFQNRIYSGKDVQEAMKTAYVLPLQGCTKEGYKVVFAGLRRTDPQYYNCLETIKMMIMVLDAWIHSEGTVPGLILVLNFGGIKLGHLTKITLGAVKKMTMYLQDGLPVRLKALHYINVIPIVDRLIALMKSLMKQELVDMLVLHQEGSNTIFDVVPKEIFPNEYGGSGGELETLHGDIYKLIEKFDAWYKEDEKLRVDESKRPGKAKTAGELFGVDGSFKKLTID